MVFFLAYEVEFAAAELQSVAFRMLFILALYSSVYMMTLSFPLSDGNTCTIFGFDFVFKSCLFSKTMYINKVIKHIFAHATNHLTQSQCEVFTYF